jgi:Transposase DDE domain group 1
MTTDCSTDLFGFETVEGREVVAAFDGGAITSDAGALLLGAADRAIGLIDRFAACFHDKRRPATADALPQDQSQSGGDQKAFRRCISGSAPASTA